MSYAEIIVPGSFSNTVGLREIPDTGSGLLLDYDPDTLISSVPDGTAITSLASKGSNPLALNTKVGTYELPKLSHGALNGHAALTFDGSNSLRTAANPTLFAEGAPSTFAVVFRTTALGDSRIFTASDVGSPTRYRGLDSGIAGSFRAQNNIAGTTVATASKSLAASVWVAVIITHSGTEMKLWNSLESTARTATITAPGRHDGLAVGINSSASLRLIGQVARVMAYDRALPTTDINALMDILCTRYGITRVTA